MKLLLLIVALLPLVPLRAAEPGDLIERLPGIRLKALAETASLREGSTAEMIKAAVAVRDRLLPSIVILESKLEGKSDKEVRAVIERDLEAISRDTMIRGNSVGRGGSIVSIESAWAVVSHLEARASWCVWQLMKDFKGFEFDDWHKRWAVEEEEAAAGTPDDR
ncbi:MAG: hypothetical protein EOP88_15410 [Verrucomicrobiaceae bacterium]|nr:MAG: hypothetical protein EOP88_15410 [Verrucomicrobiaceae bacterium]